MGDFITNIPILWDKNVQRNEKSINQEYCNFKSYLLCLLNKHQFLTKIAIAFPPRSSPPSPPHSFLFSLLSSVHFFILPNCTVPSFSARIAGASESPNHQKTDHPYKTGHHCLHRSPFGRQEHPHWPCHWGFLAHSPANLQYTCRC